MKGGEAELEDHQGLQEERLSFGVEIHYLEDERLGGAEAASRGGRTAPVMSVVLNLGQRDQV
jgi:hypothetical protein